MNENTWKQILAWEDLHPVKGEGKDPKLLRFLGRPDDLTPKARLKSIFGHPLPFDRHDWIVDRGGKEIRYVIDYYHVEEAVDLDEKPKSLTDSKSLKSIVVDARPALDDLTSISDRLIFMPLHSLQGKSLYNPPPFFKPSSRENDEKKKELEKTVEYLNAIKFKCVDIKEKLNVICSKDETRDSIECAGLTMQLQKCTASVICPDIVKSFDEVLLKSQTIPKITDNDIEKAFQKITKCNDDFTQRSRQVLSSK